jgi:hypothetical protein
MRLVARYVLLILRGRFVYFLGFSSLMPRRTGGKSVHLKRCGVAEMPIETEGVSLTHP